MLEKIKLLLGLTDTLQDEVLEIIIDDATHAVQAYIDEEYTPPEFERVIREIAITRYNRIGSEGISQESEEGRSATYDTDPLAPYYGVLDKYIENKTTAPRIAKAKFL